VDTVSRPGADLVGQSLGRLGTGGAVADRALRREPTPKGTTMTDPGPPTPTRTYLDDPDLRLGIDPADIGAAMTWHYGCPDGIRSTLQKPDNPKR
jgi:hypothetical protein